MIMLEDRILEYVSRCCGFERTTLSNLGQNSGIFERGRKW